MKPFQTKPAAPGFAATKPGPAAKRQLVRQVWGNNAKSEFRLLRNVAKRCPYVSMDTEFPGFVHNRNPGKKYFQLTPAERYEDLRANVDDLHLIQVGFSFAHKPYLPPWICFEINLRDFDKTVDRYNRDSIDLLADQGLDFEAHRLHGVDARVFADLLRSSGLVSVGNAITWVVFASGYDFGYLLKLLTRSNLPKTLPEFLYRVRQYFGNEVYDVKHVITKARLLLPGGLDPAAESLGVKRAAGKAHQAGSDSLLVADTFRRIRRVYYGNQSMGDFVGVLSGFDLHMDVAPAPNSANGNGDRNDRNSRR